MSNRVASSIEKSVNEEGANQELHVIFGTGPLGLAVMRELVSRGKEVRVVNRSGQAPVPVPAGVQVVKGDAYDPASVRKVAAGTSVAYQCAQPAYTEWVSLFPKMQSAIIDGVAPVGAKDEGRRLVVAENLYMYGRVSGPITENLPYNAHTRKGEVRARMAEQVMEAHRDGKLRTTSGRASDFYGPHALLGTPGERAFYPAIAGKRVDVLGKLDLPHTFTYIDDFARGLVTLGEHDEALGSAWHVPSAPTLTQREIVTMIFAAAGTKPQMGETPAVLLKALGLFNPLAREVVEMLYEFDEPFVMSHARFEGAFGDGATPHEDAIRETVDWFRKNPKHKGESANSRKGSRRPGS